MSRLRPAGRTNSKLLECRSGPSCPSGIHGRAIYKLHQTLLPWDDPSYKNDKAIELKADIMNGVFKAPYSMCNLADDKVNFTPFTTRQNMFQID